MLLSRILHAAPLSAPWARMITAGATSLAGVLAGPAHAAGGHHAVDDATIMDPGECQLEVWQERNVRDSGTLTHGGPGCRLGALEWGLNLDRVRAPAEAALTLVGPQAKWAMPVSPTWSVGVSVGANWTGRDGRYTSSQLLVPVTWQATPALAVHGNLGLDQQPGVGSTSRRGLAAEWTPTPHWSFIAERFDDHGARHWRGGMRYLVDERLSLDLSRAAHLGPQTRPWWAFGVNWSFSRDGRSGAAR